MRGLLLIVVLTACASSDELEVNRESCARYRDHLIELRLKDSASQIDIRAHRDAMKQALGERFIGSCQQRLSEEALRCGLHARDLASATACTKSASK